MIVIRDSLYVEEAIKMNSKSNARITCISEQVHRDVRQCFCISNRGAWASSGSAQLRDYLIYYLITNVRQIMHLADIM